MSHSFVWVDIPVRDLARAIEFYSAVFGRELTREARGTAALPPGGAFKKTQGRPKFSCAPAGGRDGHRPALGGALKPVASARSP